MKTLKHFELKSFRRVHRITQVALAKILGVSNNLISSIELGKAPMSLATYDKLRKAFPDVDMSEFEKDRTENSLVQEPNAPFSGQNAQVLFDMYQSKDKQLIECHEKTAELLREIIRLKDELAALRKDA